MSIAAAIAEVSALSRKAEIIVSLQTFTSRNLTADPPKDDDKLADLGVGDRNLDRFIRPWINKRFRDPDGNSRLPPGAITGKTTFKELCKAGGAEHD